MSTYIHLDSLYRDKEEFPNENNFQLTGRQVQGWTKYARSVRPYPQNPSLQPLDFTSSLRIISVTTPYYPEIAEQPYLFLNFGNTSGGAGFSDTSLIYTIDNRFNDEKFVLRQCRIQKDSDGNKMWIHWTADMDQVTRFRRDVEMIFTLKTRTGMILPQKDLDGGLSNQVSCTVEIIPYIRDGSYDNHYTQMMPQ